MLAQGKEEKKGGRTDCCQGMSPDIETFHLLRLYGTDAKSTIQEMHYNIQLELVTENLHYSEISVTAIADSRLLIQKLKLSSLYITET